MATMERPNRVGQGRPRAWKRLRAAIPSGRRAKRRPSLRISRPDAGAYKINVATSKGKSARPPEQTFEEIKYLKHLIEHKTPICVKLSDGEVVKKTEGMFPGKLGPINAKIKEIEYRNHLVGPVADVIVDGTGHAPRQ